MSSGVILLAVIMMAAVPDDSGCEPLTPRQLSLPEGATQLSALLSGEALPFGPEGQGWLWPVATPEKTAPDAPLSYPPASPRDFRMLAEGSLAGLLRLDRAWSDARGSEVPPGTYTLRYVPQPRMKEHQGTTTRSDFLLLIPLASDPGASAAASAVIEASRGETGGHPSVLQMVAGRDHQCPCRHESHEHADLFFMIGELMIGIRF